MARVDDERRREVLDALYRRHREEILRFVVREGSTEADAEDVVQTAFLDAYQALLSGVKPLHPRPWLFAIARNARIRGFRTRAARVGTAPLADVVAPDADPLEARELVEAIAALPQNQRSVLLLREIAGYDYDEIARRLGLSVGSVQMLLFRARRTVRGELDRRRRTIGTLLPLPSHELAGWLSHAATTMRAAPVARLAGALGLAVAGATVAVNVTPAPTQHDPRAVVTTQSQALPRVVGAVMRAHPRPAPATRAAGRPPAPRPPVPSAPPAAPKAAPAASAQPPLEREQPAAPLPAEESQEEVPVTTPSTAPTTEPEEEPAVTVPAVPVDVPVDLPATVPASAVPSLTAVQTTTETATSPAQPALPPLLPPVPSLSSTTAAVPELP